MPNKNYNRGRAFEYKRKSWYEHLGCTVLRTAGSHGPFDLVVIGENGRISLVQCKVVKSTATAKRLSAEFQGNPPLPRGFFRQSIEIFVPGDGMYMGMVERADYDLS